LNDKLNGITVEEARNTGILILQETKNTDRYIIIVPNVLLRVLNMSTNDIDDQFLDPVKNFDDRGFENAMSALRILRNNLLMKIGRKTASYRELYPHAIGYKEDLDQTVDLEELQEVQADGNPSAHDSIHKSPITAVPILHGINKTINLLKENFLVHNVPMAPSFDCLIVHHSTHNVEELQFKSSSNISNGVAPDLSSQGILQWGKKGDQFKGNQKKKKNNLGRI